MEQTNGQGLIPPRKVTEEEKRYVRKMVREFLAKQGKSVRSAVTCALAIFLLCAVLTNGANASTTKTVDVAAKMTPQDKLNATIFNIQVLLTGIAMAVVTVVLILAGIKWVASEGSPEEQARVKHWLKDIAFGTVLIALSPLFVEIIKMTVVK
jgi:heme/copper-type cytochrome/quinol oxidase subunit 2